MVLKSIVAAAALLAAFSVGPAANAAGPSKMTECAGKWHALTPAQQKATTYKAFSSNCMSAGAAPMGPMKPAAAPAGKPAMAPAKPAGPKKPPSAAQLAAWQRMRDCGAKWRADKAAGRTGNQKYQQYATACLKQK